MLISKDKFKDRKFKIKLNCKIIDIQRDPHCTVSAKEPHQYPSYDEPAIKARDQIAIPGIFSRQILSLNLFDQCKYK